MPLSHGQSEAVQFGRYTLLRKLATGGMAEVFLARQTGPAEFRRELVIKRILPHMAEEPAFLRMFLDEARLVAQLAHPNVVQIFDFGEVDGDYFIAMELIRGPDLRRMLDAARRARLPLPVPVASRIAADVCAALDYAHGATDPDGSPLEIVHRDVSPHNVLVAISGNSKLSDFGIARATSVYGKTATGTVKGKLAYMSPEQVEGHTVDRRSDIFAAGLLFCELLTGQRGIQGDSDAQVVRAVAEARVAPPRELRPDLPVEIDAVVLKAVQREPEARFQTAGEMRGAIEQFFADERQVLSEAAVAEFVRTLKTESGEPLSSLGSGSIKIRPRPPPVPAEALAGGSTGTGSIDVTVELDAVREPTAATRVATAHATTLDAGAAGEAARAFPRRRGWAAVAALVAVVALGGGAFWLGARSGPVPPPSPQGPTEVGHTSGPPPPAAPPAARWAARPPASVAGPDPEGVAPAVSLTPPSPAPAVPAATRASVLARATAKAGAPNPARPASVRPDSTLRSSPGLAGGTAFLSVRSTPWTEVYVDGRPVGGTPLVRIAVPAGRRRIRLVNAESGLERRLDVQLVPGKEHKESVAFGKGQLRFQVVPWANVTLGGRPIGQTPMPPLDLYEGTYSVALENPETGKSHRATLRIEPGSQAVVKADLRR